jgi:hypothetical protein
MNWLGVASNFSELRHPYGNWQSTADAFILQLLESLAKLLSSG